MKSPKPRNKAQRKVDYKIMRRNYHRKLLASIFCRGKLGNYRDTGVPKMCTINSNNIEYN